MQSGAESSYAWLRLAASLALMTISGVGMWAPSVALPAIQAEFGINRSDASLPYTLTMIGFGAGSLLMGRLADRFGVMVPVLVGGVSLALGFAAAALADGLWAFALAQGVFAGLLGTSSTFAPLIADTSMWFDRRRGIAVAICASGNYLAGAIWPPVVQALFDAMGWRSAFLAVAAFCLLTMLPLALVLRRRPPALGGGHATGVPVRPPKAIAVAPDPMIALLCAASFACCVAMAMPQVHIVAYCGDLGYGVARGAQMLSVMLAAGVLSRLASGWICDRIGGLRTLLLGSVLQGAGLLLFLPFDGLASLFVVSALFGFFQGGLVPSYAIIVREYFPPAQAGFKVGLITMCNQLGMAFGGWISGYVFDLTNSYAAAFLNGSAWNLVNVGVAFFLLRRTLGPGGPPARPAPRPA